MHCKSTWILYRIFMNEIKHKLQEFEIEPTVKTFEHLFFFNFDILSESVKANYTDNFLKLINGEIVIINGKTYQLIQNNSVE